MYFEGIKAAAVIDFPDYKGITASCVRLNQTLQLHSMSDWARGPLITKHNRNDVIGHTEKREKARAEFDKRISKLEFDLYRAMYIDHQCVLIFTEHSIRKSLSICNGKILDLRIYTDRIASRQNKKYLTGSLSRHGQTETQYRLICIVNSYSDGPNSLPLFL